MCLCRRVARARTARGVNRQLPGLAQRARQFKRLVEATFAQTFRVERQRDDQVGFYRLQLGELPAKIGAERQPMRILEGLDQLVEWEVIAIKSIRTVEI